MTSMQACVDEWEELNKEYDNLQDVHSSYNRMVDEVKAMQARCMKGIDHQRYRLKHLTETLNRLQKNGDEDDKKKITELKNLIDERKPEFREMEDTLPHENGIYLKIILGSVNVSLLSKRDKYKYKENYETFKLVVTIISTLFAILLWILPCFRVLDAAFQFLLVWYYCTLTIREHILKVNGSRIKGWWMTHHFISTAAAGIHLIWPEGYSYHLYRNQFVAFSIYISFVSIIQYYYQKGSLYRLRSLGEKRNMDLTVEGFQSWMWKGLSFILPFLVGGYLFQLYNAYELARLSFDERCTEWQVPALSAIFFVLFTGNTVTVSSVIKNKIAKGVIPYVIKNKYKFEKMFNSTNSTPNKKVHES